MVTDAESTEFLAKSMLRSCKRVSTADVAAINEAAQAHKEKYGVGKKRPKPFHPWQFVAKPEAAPPLYPDRKVYVKPVGCAEEPYLEHKPIGPQLNFEKRRPGVKIGDILICYAVGPQDILGYYEVETNPVEDPDGGRWPWSVQGKCLSPQYSKQFWMYSLKIGNMVHEYNLEYPGEPVSSTGNTSLGGLQWGKDKIVLDSKFADHLISRIELAQI